MSNRDYSLYADLYDERHNAPIAKKAKVFVGVLATLVVVLVGIAGALTYDDQVRTIEEYCEMVDIGAWPDFKERFKLDCGGSNPPKRVTKKLM